MTRDTTQIAGGAKQPSVSGKDTLPSFRATLERAESVLVDIATRLAPWLASLLVAWQTGTTGVRALGWPTWVGWTAGAAVECLGAASAHLWLDLRAYNSGKRKSDPAAPEALALGVVGVYFVGMGALTVASTLPILRPYMMLVVPILSAAGTLVLALRSGHVARLAQVQASKAEAQAKRKPRVVKTQSPQEVQVAAQVDLPARIFACYDEHPDWTQTQIGQAVSTTRQNVGYHLRKREPVGAKSNGHS